MLSKIVHGRIVPESFGIGWRRELDGNRVVPVTELRLGDIKLGEFQSHGTLIRIDGSIWWRPDGDLLGGWKQDFAF